MEIIQNNTVNLKEKTILEVKNQIKKVEKDADIFKKNKDIMEKEYLKYFEEIKKYTNKVELKITKLVATFPVRVHKINEDGTYDMIHPMTLICELKREYNSYEFVLVGDAPPVKSYNKLKLSVDVHKTYSRSGFVSTNNGFKIIAQLNYDKEKYYKTGKKVAELIDEYYENEWLIYKSELKSKSIKERAFDILKEKYKLSMISFTDGNFVIDTLNGNSISITYRENETGEIIFNVKNVKLRKDINLDLLVEGLGNL